MDMEAQLVPCFLVFFFVAFILKLLGQSFLTSGGGGGGRLPPGPSPLPVIGNLHKFISAATKFHISLANLAGAYGPVMSLKLGHYTFVVVSSPESAREALQKTDDRLVPETVLAAGPEALSLVWMSQGPRWRLLRRICISEIFTPHGLDASAPLRRQKVTELMSFVSERSDSPEAVVDLSAALSATMINLLWNTFFSVDVVDLRLSTNSSQEDEEEFMGMLRGLIEETVAVNLANFFPWLRAFDPQGSGRRYISLTKKIHAVLDRYIVPRMTKQMAGNIDFLDTLLGLPNLDLQTIKALFTELAAGGSYTSSNTVEWAMAELIRRPEVMEKARAEIREAVGDDKEEVEEADIWKLPYLQAVVKESIRLHPPGPLLMPRRAATAVELGGYAVPEGTPVIVNAWAIGRDASVWSDPEKFSPERFMGAGGGEADFRGGDFKLVHFGGGRRICPGLSLAFRFVHLLLASLIHRFDWKPPEGKEAAKLDMEEKFIGTLAMATPLRAIPVPVVAAAAASVAAAKL